MNNECPIPKGALVVIGGAESKEKDKRDTGMEILRQVISATPAGSPIVEVITTAGSDDPDGTFLIYERSFLDCGAGTVRHIHHDRREDVLYDDLADRLHEADICFFAGGDQLKLTSVYGGTDLLRLLKDRYIKEPLVIAGTSAGAMALSTPMIYGGVGRDEMIAGNVKVTTGLEFLRDVCVDTHFVDRGRFVRMAQVLAENPASIGIGIESDTAVIVRNGREIEVTGNGVVIIIDATAGSGTNITQFNGERLITIRDLKVHILSNGELYLLPDNNPPHY